MIRNLNKWQEAGTTLLRKHPVYDLQSREVYEIFKQAGVSDDNATEAWRVLQNVFAIGIEAGRRMQMREARSRSKSSPSRLK